MIRHKLRIKRYGEHRGILAWPFIDMSYHDVDLTSIEKATKVAKARIEDDATIELIVARSRLGDTVIKRS